MNKVNLIHSIPRSAGSVQFSFSRGKYLDGTIKSYYAPGHRPNMYWGGYTNPTDWPNAGTLLRVPQVVWLQARMAKARQINGTSFANTWKVYHPTEEGEAVVFFLGGDPNKPYSFDSGPFTQTQDNLYRTETDRLVALFGQVKSEIEGIRAGRTWIEVIDWNDWRTGGEVENDFNYGTDGFSILDIPPLTLDGDEVATPFFGTNFLNIYCGDILQGHNSFYDYFTQSDLVTPIPLNEYIEWQRNYPTLIAASRLHPAYSIRLYHPKSVFGHWIIEDVSLPLVAVDETGSLHARDDAFNGYPGRTSAAMDEACSLAAGDDLDMTHPGDTSSITATSLKTLIADHFGFNSDTGKDL